MLICALCVLPIWFAQSFDNLWAAVLVIGVLLAMHALRRGARPIAAAAVLTVPRPVPGPAAGGGL